MKTKYFKFRCSFFGSFPMRILIDEFGKIAPTWFVFVIDHIVDNGGYIQDDDEYWVMKLLLKSARCRTKKQKAKFRRFLNMLEKLGFLKREITQDQLSILKLTSRYWEI